MDVNEFVQSKVLPEYRDIVAMLRTLMKEMDPDVQETLSYGILAFKKKRIIAVVNPTKNGITFAFSQGAEFKDNYNILKGVGKVSKHIKIKSIDAIPKETLKYYINQAVTYDLK